MFNLAPLHHAAVAMGPVAVAARLGFRLGSRSHRGACPIHGGKNASSFGLDARNGTLVGACHSCGWGGDVLALVGAIEGLDRFGDVVKRAAELLGADVVERPDVHRQPAAPEPPKPYPSADEVALMWMSCPAGECSAETVAYLTGRGFGVEILREMDVVRELTPEVTMPTWARIRGRDWYAAGYRLVACAYDAHGVTRSLRAWRTVETGGDLPKRLAPSGKRVSGLVLANARGALLLRSPEYFVDCGGPIVVRICEGEPDLLAVASAFHDTERQDDPVLAVTSATAWPPEVGDRIPDGARVIVYPDQDRAGQNLLDAVRANLGKRCRLSIARPENG